MSNYTAINREEICKQLKAMAKSKKKLLIVCHQNPDGDAVGSAFALKLIYESLGGSAKCVCASDAPRYLHFMYSGQVTIGYRVNDDERHDAFCAVDVASPRQLGKLDFLIGKFDFMIDHHGMGEAFAPHWIEPDASACSEMIAKIYKKLVLDASITKNPDIARCLYTGIAADTGSFKYSNTSPETLIIASGLIDEIGKANDGNMSASEISRVLFDNNTHNDIAAKKLTYNNLRFAADGRIAYCVITSKEMNKAGISEQDMGGCVDIVRSIEGVLVGLIIKQNKKLGEFRISARSNCDIDVAKICAKFGGGGHAKAAGASVPTMDAEKAKRIVIEEFEAAVNECAGEIGE